MERRALERARRRLPIPAGETPLEFDVGNAFMSVLPSPFGFPTNRVDLICTGAALYIHADGRSARYPWADVLTVSASPTPLGQFVKGRFSSGENLSVNVGKAPRPLVPAMEKAIEVWEAGLTAEALNARRELLALHELRDTLAVERRERMKNINLRPPTAYGSAFERETGREVGGGVVTFDDDSLWFHDSSGMVGAIVPYDSLREFDTGRSPLRADCILDTVEYVTVRTDDESAWLEILDAHNWGRERVGDQEATDMPAAAAWPPPVNGAAQRPR